MKSKSKKNEQTKEKQALEKENAGLKKMYPDAMPGMKILQETIEKKFRARRTDGILRDWLFRGSSAVGVRPRLTFAFIGRPCDIVPGFLRQRKRKLTPGLWI